MTPSLRGPLSLTDARWEVVANRDVRSDERFVYAVSTTGVYCRPSCPARTPRREHVALFAGPADAEAAGYRPCQRCRPTGAPSRAERAVQAARERLDAAVDAEGDVPTLAALGQAVGLSPGHLQRTFARTVGLSPRAYADARRAERARAALREGATVLEATFEGGFGAGKALYDRADALGATPGVLRRRGRGLRVRYAVFETALGAALVAATDRGVCAVALGDDVRALEDDLQRDFAEADLARDDVALGPWAEPVLRALAGPPGADLPGTARSLLALPLDVRGTVFQRRVWDALRSIPVGETRSYAEVAAAIGRPTAARAVAQACGANPAALLVPCHRVVGSDGTLRGYRWGADVKRRLLERESPDTPPR